MVIGWGEGTVRDFGKVMYSMLCASLDGKGVWGRMNTCICMTESHRCLPGMITKLLIGYTPIQNKKV